MKKSIRRRWHRVNHLNSLRHKHMLLRMEQLLEPDSAAQDPILRRPDVPLPLVHEVKHGEYACEFTKGRKGQELQRGEYERELHHKNNSKRKRDLRTRGWLPN